MRRIAGLALALSLVAAPAAAQFTTFGDGIHAVGTDIAAGTYATDGGESCYWARLSGLGGTSDEIIANGNPTGPIVVRILATDTGFETQGCGVWAPAKTPIAAPSPDASPAPGPRYSTLTEMGAVIAPFAESMADIADGFDGSLAAYARELDRIADDLAAGLLTITPHPCLAEGYAAMWTDVGGLRLWAELLRHRRAVNAIHGATFITANLMGWFLPERDQVFPSDCPPEVAR
jgi:hypothetical protein